MKKLIIPIVAIVVIVVAAAAYVLREPEEASAPIEAVPLELEATEPAADEAVTEETAVENAEEEVMEEPTAAAEEVAEADTTETGAVVEPTDEPTAEPAGEVRVFQISQTDSEVRFILDEELRGQPTTVVGTTNQVAGELALNLTDLAATQVGVIQINARTLATDNNFRNRAIQNEILDTGSFEFITFTPAAVNGLPASAGVGDEVTFTIEGDLTIRDITQPVTFEVVATAVSDTQLTGTASTVISRGDYNLNIPQVPSVANVEEEVELYIDFVADAS